MKFSLATLFGLLVFSSSVFASNSIEFLNGRWEGSGKKLQDGAWVERASTECNHSGTNGTGIIQAKYVEVQTGKVHGEYGVISHKGPSPTLYDFKMVRHDGSKLDAEAVIEGNSSKGSAILAFDIPPATPGQPNRKVKYVTTVKGNEWYELGSISMDGGKTFVKIYEMNLKKVAGYCVKL